METRVDAAGLHVGGPVRLDLGGKAVQRIDAGPGPALVSARARGAGWIALALVLLGPSPAHASQAGLSGGEGHPRARFPLALHASPAGDPSIDAAIRRAVDDWNALFTESLGLEAFTWVARPADAHVLVAADTATTTPLMGETRMRAAGGVIELPVHVLVFAPRARGQTPRDVVVYQVVAHELGHALGLAHTTEPRSLMCCDHASIDFTNAAVREAYIEARRRPDLASVRAQLIEHYRRFWGRP